MAEIKTIYENTLPSGGVEKKFGAPVFEATVEETVNSFEFEIPQGGVSEIFIALKITSGGNNWNRISCSRYKGNYQIITGRYGFGTANKEAYLHIKHNGSFYECIWGNYENNAAQLWTEPITDLNNIENPEKTFFRVNNTGSGYGVGTTIKVYMK